MIEYPKIETLFKRDKSTHKVIVGEWKTEEFDYLQNNSWLLTEKVDGTNIRVILKQKHEQLCPTLADSKGDSFFEWIVEFRGITDAAKIPPFLLEKLKELFPLKNMTQLWKGRKNCEVCHGSGTDESFGIECGCVVPYPITLYGEGYGARIQKGGGNYIPDGVSFVLFDVKIGDWWLNYWDVVDIAFTLGIECVPIIATGTLLDATKIVKEGLTSKWGNFSAEGLVVRPEVPLSTRNGKRIIGKIKTKDF